MASTYEKIATTTLGSTAASVTLSSIPATYTDLVYVFNGAGSTAANVFIEFNGDTGSNYSMTTMSTDGITPYAFRFATQSSLQLTYQGYLTTAFSSLEIIDIMNYSNTTTYKAILNRYNNGNTGTDAQVGQWRSTTAINSILIKPGSGTFSVGSTFTLYGIKAA
jgi:hypothetical protein